MSSTPSPNSKGQQRTRNAQAQADLRARRKAYIKSLEHTVSSLEACVRSLRAQNSDLISSSSSSFAYKDPQSPSDFCDEVERLKGENARLHTLLAEAGLAAAAATRLAKMGKDSPLHEGEIGSETLGKSKAVAKSGRAEGGSWSNTSSITTKKRKLTKMQAFAKDVDSQVHSLPSSSTPLLSSAAVEPQNTLTAFESGMTTFEHSDQQVIHAYMTSTLSASSSSRASVVSHRSPKTPRFDAVEIPTQKADFSFDPAQGLPLTHVERPWPASTNPPNSIPLSQFAPPQQQRQTFILPRQNLHQTELLTTWLDHQLSPHWPPSITTTIPSSSASISDARCPTLQLLPLLFTFLHLCYAFSRAQASGCGRWKMQGGKMVKVQILEPAILV